jgi:hypothetical protein
MNVKPKKYLTQDGKIIENNKSVEYHGEHIVESTLIEFYDASDTCINRKTTYKTEFTEQELLYLCLSNKASYCRISTIFEVEHES